MKTDDDDQSQAASSLTIEKAKNWYETVLSACDSNSLRNVDGNGEGEIALKPLLNWDIAELNDNALWEAVELPWEYENTRIEAATTEAKEYALNYGADIQQVNRLVILQDKLSGKIYGFRMLVLPDLDYMLAAGDKINEIKYLDRDANFRGLILFYEMDGAFVNGWRYSDEDSADESAQGALRSDYYIITEYCQWLSISADGGETWSEKKLLSCKIVVRQTMESHTGDVGGFNNIFTDTTNGGGGGGGSNNKNDNTNPDPVTPAPEADAKKLFRNSNMSEKNWKTIQNMLIKIIKDCLGKSLYDGLLSSLNGNKLTIEFIPGSSSEFFFNGSTSGIKLGVESESNGFFHEMWHGYQAYQETPSSFGNSIMNLEIEAQYAQYLYLKKLPEYKGSEWEEMHDRIGSRRNAIRELDKYIDEKGNYLSGKSKDSLDLYLLNTVKPIFEKDNTYKNYPYNFDRVGLDNFKNLQKLTINCN